jgi:hypothetical protein
LERQLLKTQADYDFRLNEILNAESRTTIKITQSLSYKNELIPDLHYLRSTNRPFQQTMRNIFILCTVLLLNLDSFAQQANTLFFTYTRSNPEPVYNGSVDGGAGYRPVTSNSFGLRYLMKSTKVITLETGIDYSLYHFKLDYVDNPGIVIPDVKQTIKLFSVPVYAHLTFLKYFFVNGGLLIDSEIKKQKSDIDRQSGIGFGLGIGLKYHYKKANIFVNPFLERHAFWAFRKPAQGTRQSLLNSGGRIGIGYSF